jgi:hypothetical protein
LTVESIRHLHGCYISSWTAGTLRSIGCDSMPES